MIDKDTGKAKGYGFCEYRDAETANSAMRNLNNREMNGRFLRVDFADNERTEGNPKEVCDWNTSFIWFFGLYCFFGILFIFGCF